MLGLLEFGDTYSNLKVHLFFRKCRHLVVETKTVLAYVIGSKHVIALSLLGTLHDEFLVGSRYGVIDIKGAARLNLDLTHSPLAHCYVYSMYILFVAPSRQ